MSYNPYQGAYSAPPAQPDMTGKKYCKFCGTVIDADCVVCPSCGKQVEELRYSSPPPSSQPTQPQVIINNTNTNRAPYAFTYRKRCDKWAAFFLGLFLGPFGAHKFYEGRTGMGLLYLFTMGLCGIGWVVDIFLILFKSNPYYV